MSAGSCPHTHGLWDELSLSPPAASHHLHHFGSSGLGAGNGFFSAKGHFSLPRAFPNQVTPMISALLPWEHPSGCQQFGLV